VKFALNQHYVRGLGCPTIAKAMAEKGWRNASNGEWDAQAVHEVVHRTLYTGRGISKMRATGKFNVMDREAPREVNYDLGEMMNVAHKRTTLRPPEDWEIKEYPTLFGILEDDFRESVWEQQKAYFIDKATNKQSPPNRDKHRTSKYFLKQVLQCKHTGKLFCGKLCGKHSRSYHLNYFQQFPCLKRPWMRRRIPAESTEMVAKSLLAEVLSSSGDLRRLVMGIVTAEVAQSQKATSQLDEFVMELAAVDRKLAFAVSELADIGEDAVRKMIGPLKDRRRVLEANVTRLRSMEGNPKVDVTKIVDEIVHELSDIGAHIDGMEPQVLRNLFLSFAEMRVDLEKMEIDVDVRLPRWAITDASKIRSRVGLVSDSSSLTRDEAHTSKALILASYGCSISVQPRGSRAKSCVTCTRKAA
jgi:hypothetical protein